MQDVNRNGPCVLQVLPALGTGGVERGTIEMTQAIAEGGGRAIVASAGGPHVASVVRSGGEHVMLPLDRKSPWAIWRNADALARLIRARGVVIVHARSRAPAWSAYLASRRTGARFVTTYHGVYSENAPLKRHYNAVMAKGERVIAISHHVAGVIAERHRIDAARVRIIPRGVDPAVFDPESVNGQRVQRLMQAWRIPDGASVALLPARLTRWKGQLVLLDAIARLGRPDVFCVLLGSDQGRAAYTAELIRHAEALGIAGRLRLPGNCEDMPAAYLLADIVVHASIKPEPFGRVVIEAQAMARPVIASDLGGPRETVAHDETGVLVRPDDADALAAALAAMLAMPAEERIAMGLRARDSVLAHYTTAAMQQATLGVYNELL